MLWKCCTQYASKFGKFSSGHQTGKCQPSFQSQRRAMPKNVQTIAQLQSFHMRERLFLKSVQLGFSNMWTENFQMCKLGLENVKELEIKVSTFFGSWWRQENSRKTSTFASLTVKAFDCVQLSHSVMSDSLQSHGLWYAKLPCPSPTPRTCSNSCPSSQWWHPTISSSVIPFFSCLQSFPTSGSFPMSWFFTTGGQSISLSFSISPSNIQDLFLYDWLVGYPCCPRDPQESSPTLCGSQQTLENS